MGRALCCDPRCRLVFYSGEGVLRDLGSDEPSFGIALQAFVTHPDLSATIAEAEGVEFRVWVGSACLLAVYGWADSVPNELCRLCAF